MANLKRTAIWITLLAIFLKASGFIRESITSTVFGVSHETDGYVYAFSLITLVVAMISGGFNNVFLPLYTKRRKEKSDAAEKDANGIMNGTVLLFLLVSVIGYFVIPYIIPYITPASMNIAAQKVAIKTMQIFFIAITFVALNGILDSYLQARRSFVPSQIAKILATMMGALFAILFHKQMGIYSLAIGFVVGTIMGVIVQFFYLQKSNFRWMPALKVEKDFRKTFLVLIIPSLLNSVVGQFNMFVNKTFAAGTGDGGTTYLDKASLLVSIPNTIYATTIVVIIFTLLSEQVDDKKKFQDTMHMGMMISLVTLLPMSVGLLLLGKEAIAFIYQHGLFTATDTENTYIAMVLYLPMIIAQGLQFIVSKSMYARGKTATVFRISITTVVLNFVLNWLIVDSLGYKGLAVTSSVVAIYFLVVSAIVMYRDFDKSESKRLIQMFILVIPPTLLMALPVYALKAYTPLGNLPAIIQLALFGALGAVLYIIGLKYFYKEAYAKLMSLVRRKKAAA
ncbi:murein biosynthesis integral membrane protein MurJ [Bacillus testis]|uniref:murein biosynthesis integral membrane protein MurJ n=1 Tax=Bacillus testis TaxID=1622072 RepID=UPI00067EE82F|nr:lipid II flippase MurJ [Bacillus testis]